MLDEALLRKLGTYFGERDDVYAVYLFGSHAKGTARAASDIDLAVLFKEGIDMHSRFRSKLDMTNDLEDLCAHKVDVVDLRSADLVLIHQVMLHKVLLHERDPSSRIAFEVAARKRYWDHVPILEQYHAQARERLRHREPKEVTRKADVE